MTDLKARLKPVFRRTSTTASAKSDLSASSTDSPDRNRGRNSLRLASNRKTSSVILEQEEKELPSLPAIATRDIVKSPTTAVVERPGTDQGSSQNTPIGQQNLQLVVEHATPEPKTRTAPKKIGQDSQAENPERLGASDARFNPALRPNLAERRQSPISFENSRPFPSSRFEAPPNSRPPQNSSHLRNRSKAYTKIMARKVWVKRPNAVATQVTISEDDLVDDVKDMVLRKYANSLGRNFDPPDVSLKIVLGPGSSRHTNEKALAPDENIAKILDVNYPGGQTIDEALLVDVPRRRTPQHSPRVPLPYYVADDVRPHENGTDYFPPMPLAGPQSPHLPSTHSVATGHPGLQRPPGHPHSMAVIETGHVAPLPSPGGAGRIRYSDRSSRPRIGLQHTSSPTVLVGPPIAQHHDINKTQVNTTALATPPILEATLPHRIATPPPRTSSPRPAQKPKKPKKDAKEPTNGVSAAGSIAGLLEGAVPPINVLIVEDNIINLKLLEAFLKRLKVRWSTAMNGQIAVNKWREGGFHLVLMDIQLPVMSGLDATREIRRLERVNNIGVFSGSASSPGSTPTFEKSVSESVEADADNADHQEEEAKKPEQKDNLMNTAIFKSPVIIVALTASSLQSDRHAALAAGCNDFLTKPVAFDWLSRKVMEWGCMQALIDFDGWRKWKDFSAAAKPAALDTTTLKAKEKMGDERDGDVGRSPNAAVKLGERARHMMELSHLERTSSSGDGEGEGG